MTEHLPGETLFAVEDLILNAGREATELSVTNTGDRAIQVGSHFHFFEANRALHFDRRASFGKRLNIPSGTAVRFEAGQTHIHFADLVRRPRSHHRLQRADRGQRC